jgi:hypothetical protein
MTMVPLARRELFKAVVTAAVLGSGSASKAGAQSKPKTRKDLAMARLEVHTTTIAVEHVTVPSQKSFESVKTELESLVPRIDDGVFVLLRWSPFSRSYSRSPFAVSRSPKTTRSSRRRRPSLHGGG